jgi:hypothetical protein
MKRFVPLTRKINLIIVSSLVVGVGIVIVYFAFTQNLSLRQTSRASLRQQSDILFYKIFLLRENGVQAFSDNSTIETVNANLGLQRFEPKEVLPPTRSAIQPRMW